MQTPLEGAVDPSSPVTSADGLRRPSGAPNDHVLISDPDSFTTTVPHPEFARLRRETPVAWIEETLLCRHGSARTAQVKGTGYWAVTSYATLMAVSRAPEVFSSAARGAFLTDPVSQLDLERNRQLLINMDGPQHRKFRCLVAQAFTPEAVRRLEQSTCAHARSLVNLVRNGEPFEAVRDLAAELPLLVLTDLLGIPRADRGLLFKWSNQLVGFDDPDYGGGDVEAYKQAFVEAFQYGIAAATAKRRSPGQDLLSRLIECEIDDRPLTEAEFCHLWMMLVVAGNESTRHLLSGSLQALIEWPAERARLAADPALVPCAVEELLRWVSPIMQFRRTAMRDTELCGQLIREGDKVILYYISANRDEVVFTQPCQLDLGRSPNPHVAFGVGPHACLGGALARLEAVALLTEILPHIDGLESAGPIVRLRSNFMNGIKSLPLRFAVH